MGALLILPPCTVIIFKIIIDNAVLLATSGILPGSNPPLHLAFCIVDARVRVRSYTRSPSKTATAAFEVVAGAVSWFTKQVLYA